MGTSATTLLLDADPRDFNDFVVFVPLEEREAAEFDVIADFCDSLECSVLADREPIELCNFTGLGRVFNSCGSTEPRLDWLERSLTFLL